MNSWGWFCLASAGTATAASAWLLVRLLKIGNGAPWKALAVVIGMHGLRSGLMVWAIISQPQVFAKVDAMIGLAAGSMFVSAAASWFLVKRLTDD